MDFTRGFFDSDFESFSSGERIGNVTRDRMLLQLEAKKLSSRHTAATELPEVIGKLACESFTFLYAYHIKEVLVTRPSPMINSIQAPVNLAVPVVASAIFAVTCSFVP